MSVSNICSCLNVPLIYQLLATSISMQCFSRSLTTAVHRFVLVPWFYDNFSSWVCFFSSYNNILKIVHSNYVTSHLLFFHHVQILEDEIALYLLMLPQNTVGISLYQWPYVHHIYILFLTFWERRKKWISFFVTLWYWILISSL